MSNVANLKQAINTLWLVALLNECGERSVQVSSAGIIVVQTVQHRRGNDGACDEWIVLLIPIRYLLLNTLMRATLVVIGHILPHQPMHLKAMQNEHIVQTFPLQTADEPLTDAIGLHRQLHP
jgi:hypothetical protein